MTEPSIIVTITSTCRSGSVWHGKPNRSPSPRQEDQMST